MQVTPGAIQSDLQNILKDVIDSIPIDGAFDDDLTKAKKVPEGEARVVEIGDLKFKVEVEDRVSNTLKAATLTSNVKNDADVASSRDQSDTPEPKAQTKAEPDAPKQQGVHPGVTLNLRLLDPSQLTAKLPNSVRSLIEQTVQVIKIYRQDIEDVQYKFKFAHLNMEVSVADIDDKLQIKISVQDGELKQDMYSEENQKLLLNVLQQEFGDEDIELIFVDEHEQAMKKDQSDNSGQNQDQTPEEGSEPDEDT